MATTIKDLGIGKLREQLEQLGRVKVLVGVQGDKARAKHPNAKESVGTIAFWLHYGTRSMPARPYIDRAIAALSSEVGSVSKRAVAALIDGRVKTVAEAVGQLGTLACKAVRHEFDTAQDWAAPLAPLTIARKGHAVPLVDTGTVRDSITYTVRDGEAILRTGDGEHG